MPLDLRQQLRAPQFELSLGHHTRHRGGDLGLEKLGAPYKLLATVGSWADAEVLDHLKIWNETGDIKLDPIRRLTRWANAAGTFPALGLSLTFA